MKVEWNGMKIEGTPYELAFFVAEYKAREKAIPQAWFQKPPYTYPYPYWMSQTGMDSTNGTPRKPDWWKTENIGGMSLTGGLNFKPEDPRD